MNKCQKMFQMEQVKDNIWAKETCHVVAKTACYTEYELWASLQASAIFTQESVFIWLMTVLNACQFCIFHFVLTVEIQTPPTLPSGVTHPVMYRLTELRGALS